MGIKGLHPFLESIAVEVHLSELEGQTVAIDASAWLHKGLHSCPLELIQGQGTDRFLDVPLRLVDQLQRHKVKPYFVLDGAVLPMKAQRAAEEGGRRSQRDAAFDKALERLRDKGPTSSEAMAACSKALTVLPWMATRFIEELRRRKIPCVVAPYEADPQIAFLVREGHCDCALSEDSDLLAYGCPSVIYKLGQRPSAPDAGTLIALENLRGVEDGQGRHLFDGTHPHEWTDWTDGGRFVDLCILAGTDYLPALPGIGIKSAHKAVRMIRNGHAGRGVGGGQGGHAGTSSYGVLEEVVRGGHLPGNTKGLDTEGDKISYLKDAARVRHIFRHALVYDPRTAAVVPLNPWPSTAGGRLPEYLGRPLERGMARQVCADGTHDPMTLTPRSRHPQATERMRLVAAALADFEARAAAAAAYQALPASQLPASQLLASQLPGGSQPSDGWQMLDHVDTERPGGGHGTSPEGAAAQDDDLPPRDDLAGLVALAEQRANADGSQRSVAAGGMTSGHPLTPPPAEEGPEEELDEEEEDARCTRGLIVEYVASQASSWELGQRARLVQSFYEEPRRGDPILNAHGELWLLHLALCDRLHVQLPQTTAAARDHPVGGGGRMRGAAKPPTSALPAPSSQACQQALAPALAFLTRLVPLAAGSTSSSHSGEDDGAAWPAAAREDLANALVCCWRQALLEPLRAAGVRVDWAAFLERCRAVPAPAAEVLRPELEELQWDRSTEQPCGCIAGSRNEVQKRIQAYTVRHPPTEMCAPLREVLTAAANLLPPAVISSVEIASHLKRGSSQTGLEGEQPALQPTPKQQKVTATRARRSPRVSPGRGGGLL